MSKYHLYINPDILDCVKKKPLSDKLNLPRYIYRQGLWTLIDLFSTKQITFHEFMSSLHILLLNYRKDFPHV